MVEITIDYEGQLHCAATHGPSGTQIATDAPVDNHGRGEAFSPTDLVASALGTCMVTIMGIAAQKHDIDLTGTKIRVEKHMSTDLPRRISSLPVTITVPLPAEHPNRPALEAAAKTCPVAQSLHPDLEKPVEFQWIG